MFLNQLLYPCIFLIKQKKFSSMKSYFKITDSTGKSLHAVKWLPDGNPKAVVQILHGMAEHSERYNHFARFLTGHGYAVIAHDHRGHGKTDPEDPGFVSEENGFGVMVQNVEDVKISIQKEFPGLPLVMFGHSMGSFLLQRYMQILKNAPPACIIYTGSNGKPPFLLHSGILIASIQKKLFGPEAKSPLLNKLSFGAFNKSFKPNRTAFDWLSRDHEMVDLYIDDPYCGFICTTSFYHQFFEGLKSLHSHKPFADHAPSIPVLIASGDNDPVSGFGKGIKSLEKLIQKSGINHVEVQLYPGARHEILNETNRDEIMKNILYWIETRLNFK